MRQREETARQQGGVVTMVGGQDSQFVCEPGERTLAAAHAPAMHGMEAGSTSMKR